jgi:hypothetical protein
MATSLTPLLDCEPTIVGLQTAREAGLPPGSLSHAGPPYAEGEAIPLPVLYALGGACVLEGWAADQAEGVRLVSTGAVPLHSNHALGFVSPMAGVVRPGQPLFRVSDPARPDIATFATLAEPGRRVLRFGVFDPAARAGLHELETMVAPAIAAALPPGGLPIVPLIAEALALGDDVHQRNVGGLYALLRALPDLPAAVRRWLGPHPQFFLNFAMAAAKLSLDRLRGQAGSAIVTAISRNGVSCGIQLAGTADRWFTAPAEIPVGGLFAPNTPADVQPDLGDSAIMEAYGLGGCVAHLAPELTRLLGVSWSSALAAGAAQRGFFTVRNDRLSPVASGDAGVGAGLDARAVLASADKVRIHTGIAHRDGATGWIGVGVAGVPRACFTAAVAALDAGG